MRARARCRSASCSRASCALEGSISGEHGIGFAKAQYLGLELSPDAIALMERVKLAFDPNGILNPGKLWESAPRAVHASLNDTDNCELIPYLFVARTTRVMSRAGSGQSSVPDGCQPR